MITPVSRHDIYIANVLTSTFKEKDQIEYINIISPSSASNGLNNGIDRAVNDLVICCHQDVYFLNGWYEKLKDLLKKLDGINSKWGVCGMAGTTYEGRMVGTCSGLGMNGDIIKVQTLDCFCQIMRKSSGLRFDEGLKYFHMYGEDIALDANDKRLGAYVLNIGIDHRTKWTAGQGFIESTNYLRQKWKNKFGTIYTTVGNF